ncbi:sigma factor [Nonomuraea sp. NPDC050691]|uniref:RNA polymerase sigma factor n=1 Tax=Nonomuraea sp. NPDC050691 TaxID=3155661 RepID=UPI0033C6D741
MDDDRRTRFEAVYEQTYEQILGYAVRRCDSPEDAADVVSETFAIAWRRVDALPPGDEARLWLYGDGPVASGHTRRRRFHRPHFRSGVRLTSSHGRSRGIQPSRVESSCFASGRPRDEPKPGSYTASTGITSRQPGGRPGGLVLAAGRRTHYRTARFRAVFSLHGDPGAPCSTGFDELSDPPRDDEPAGRASGAGARGPRQAGSRWC